MDQGYGKFLIGALIKEQLIIMEEQNISFFGCVPRFSSGPSFNYGIIYIPLSI